MTGQTHPRADGPPTCAHWRKTPQASMRIIRCHGKGSADGCSAVKAGDRRQLLGACAVRTPSGAAAQGSSASAYAAGPDGPHLLCSSGPVPRRLRGGAQRPLSAGALRSRAAEAVRGRGDGRAPEPLVLQGLDVEDGEAGAAEGQLQLLVEVTVVEAAVPANVDVVLAHEHRNSLWVEVANKQVHVALQGALFPEEVEEALHRHVCYGDELVEFDAVGLSKLMPILCLEWLLLGRQEGAWRVEN
mmetsp:Transcript_78471/g.230129  ORF Transcript_78471/g.230129 Transcript_78471/m.230129 type:complete len:244 (+) Transcript_78471:288-1019(+)